MTLLSIESSSEQLAIVKYVMPIILASEYQFFIYSPWLAQLQIICADPLASKIGAWVSGAYIPALNTFYWASSRIYFLYANWFFNEPNNSPSAQCVRLVPTPLGNWASLNCDQWLPFVCQGWSTYNLISLTIISLKHDCTFNLLWNNNTRNSIYYKFYFNRLKSCHLVDKYHDHRDIVSGRFYNCYKRGVSGKEIVLLLHFGSKFGKQDYRF